MNEDELFRWIMVAGFVASVPFGLYHRIRSQASGERLDRRQEGWFILATLRPVGIASIVATLAFMIRPDSMAWSQLPLPTAIRWCGVSVGVATAALFIGVLRSIGDNITDTVVTRKQHQLICHGPYRYVRHPLYSATFLYSMACGLVTANWFITVTGLAAFTLLLIRSKTEERFLIERFGDDYRQYKERTGSVFPKLGG